MARLFLSAVLLAALAALPARAAQDDPRLSPLFAKLKAPTTSDEEARATEQQIWQIWVEHKNPEVERLMRQGMAAMNEDEKEDALAAFNEVVHADKNFAEGWNKRATIEFVMGDFAASIADIERTLALEPRHFGALSGLGEIYLALDKKDLALKAFKDVLAIDPHATGAKQAVEALEKQLQGNPI